MNIPTQISDMLDREPLFVLNDSGGKDSQAMRILLCTALRERGISLQRHCIVVHAALGRVEWDGALEHAQAGAAAYGIGFMTAVAKRSLLQMVEERHASRPGVPSWPSSSCRQCTSDLKRGPIRREIRRWLKFTNRRLVINCIGERAQESPDRAKKPVLKLNKSLCTKTREWWDWYPIHDLSTAQVFQTIADAGERPHPAYAKGNERLSCVFCIFGSRNDLRNGAIARPELYREYVALERKTGYTMHMSRLSLPQLTGVEVA